jgi:6-phosphogluconolactonase (cycloisomerase 2 family)
LNQTTGVPTYAGDDQTLPGNTYPSGLSIDPSGRFAYLGNGHYVGGFRSFKIDSITGALTSLGGLSLIYCGQAAVVPSGSYGYVPCNGAVEPFTIEPSSGALASITGSTFVSGATAVSTTADTTGKFLYATTGTGNSLLAYEINGSTGAFSPVYSSPIAAGSNPVSLAIDPSSHYLYVVNQGGNNVSAYAMGLELGDLTLIDTYAAGTAPAALVVAGTPP